MIHWNINKWQDSFRPPALSDIRWRAFGLLFTYLVFGMTFLGFSRKPGQVFILITTGALLDMAMSGLIKGRKVFPLSAMISCSSLAILLNWSFDFHYLFLPVFICIASKYLITFNDKHFFNPSLFAICISILFGKELVTLSPSYQWYGSAASAWLMMYFVITAALLFFVFRINRLWLIGSFLITFLTLTVVRAIIMQHVIPFETLFISALTSPAFYLFTFYMITDPATSPKDKRDQIVVGIGIAVLDLIFHLKFSLYTFFFAGLTIASLRFGYFHIKKWWSDPQASWKVNYYKYPIIALLALPVLWSFTYNERESLDATKLGMRLTPISREQSGFYGNRGQVIESVDSRIANVAKWVLSVGDAVAIADINGDDLPDVFLTQSLKSKSDQGKLYINKGNFRFEKVAIADLERYIGNPKEYGIPGFALFLDYDNDGDKDLFVGFGFGKSHLFANNSDGQEVKFSEVSVPFLLEENTVCLAANGLDANNDGKLDLLLTNTLHQYLPDYEERVPLNIFDLPQPAYKGDRRMYHFLHESWHNANNGGLNHLLTNIGGEKVFEAKDSKQSQLKETRWSLAVGTNDMNQDGYTDLFIANDFGRDDWYLNDKKGGFVRQQGKFYGDIGLDTYKGMNASLGDLDGNGLEDVYVSNVHHEMQAEGSLAWLNHTKTGAAIIDFKESAQRLNLLNTNRFGWGAAIGDLDLNGYPDVVQANGMVDDHWDKKWDEAHDFWYYQAQIARTGPEVHSYADKWADVRGCYIYPNEQDRISLNKGNGYFSDASDALGFNHMANTRGVALADLDNDGDLDILITNQFGDPFLYQNEVSQKKWIGITLVGNGLNTNSDAVGSKVILHYKINGAKVTQIREMKLANGFLAMGDTRLLFGLGHDQLVSDISLAIHWHNGKVQNIGNLKTNQYHTITQK